MKIVRFPVAVWEDHEGGFTAKTLDGEPAVAVDVTPAGAVTQLKNYLRWRLRQDDFWQEPDMQELEQTDFRIRVRPQYRTERSVFPSEQPITLRVPAVVGRRGDHSCVCCVPAIDIQVSCVSRELVDELCREALMRELSGLPPRDVVRNLPPKQMTVRSLNVKCAGSKRTHTEANLPTLRVVAEPLGERSLRQRFGRAWGRDSQLQRLVTALSSRTNILLAGEAGGGKTTLLANAVRQLERVRPEDKTERLPTKHRFWLTNGARLIAGMQYLGQWEDRCEMMIDELSEIGGVLCAESLLDLVRYGSGDPSSSVAAFLTPYLENGELQLAAEATPVELDACRRLLPSFAALFQIHRLHSFSAPQAQTALSELITDAARNARVEVDARVPARTLQLFRRFLPYQPFPGQASNFIKRLIEKKADGALLPADIDDRFRRLTGLPDALLQDEISLPKATVCQALEQQIYGQRDACHAAAEVVTRFKAGLNDPERPLGVLLFCGPTGVGKTELAKSFSRYLFGQGDGQASPGMSDNRLLRLDMSEYSGFDAAERLLMRPDGKPSVLIEQIRVQPFAVVLLDEIEKASPQVFDLLLGMLDEGRLTDRYGRTTVFRSAVIIMTSNLGASRSDPVGFGSPAPRYEREVRAAFRPEFFNRIDSVVTFEPLQREAILDITRKELRELAAREGFRKQHLTLQFPEAVVEHLAEAGFDPLLGARPLQRTLERSVVAPLARVLASRQDIAGRQVLLDLDRGEVIASVVPDPG